MSKKLSYLFAFLCSFISTLALAGPLQGNWNHDGKRTSISINSAGQYVFCNEMRDCANGFKGNYNTVSVPSWGVTGTINGNTIIWSNGSQWEKLLSGGDLIAGAWFHDGQPTSIQVAMNGVNFILTNEQGQSSKGYIQNGNELVLSSLNIRGRLNDDHDVIRWSNNTVWTR